MQPGQAPGGTSTQPAPIVSQTLMLPGQVMPISITSDDGNNSLVFYSTPRQYGLLQDALHQLDVLPLQVLIEAVVDQFEPPMPAKIEPKQALHFAESLARGEPDRMKIITTIAEDRVKELV